MLVGDVRTIRRLAQIILMTSPCLPQSARTLPALSAAIATVTFSASRGHISYAVVTPANAATALLSGTSMVFMSSNGATAYTLSAGTTALTAATTYAWNVVAF